MIKQQIEADIKQAMLAGDKRLVEVLRTVKSAILDGEVAAGKRDTGLPEEDVIKLLQKESKKRADAAELYKQAGDNERTEKEAYEQKIIATYLPEMMNESDIEALVDKVLSGLSEPPTKQQMGQIIGAVKVQSEGLADGAIIARLVKKRLG